MSFKTDRKRRNSSGMSPQPTSPTRNKDMDKRQKTGHGNESGRSFSPRDGPSTSKSQTNSNRDDPLPPPTLSNKPNQPSPNTPSGSHRMTKALFEQIPYLEVDPLKALEMLKKMVQESGLETLYANVNENTNRARDFSDRIATLKTDVNDILKFMLSGRPSEQEKLEKYKQMKGIWSKIHGLNEAKVKLTQSAYDMVDRVIRRLDKELESINNEIGTEKSVGREKGPSKKNSCYRPYTGAMGSSFDPSNRSRPGRGVDFDMPVDPNEPTYCECKQISYGEMIACDNVSCPIEWFHFSCVNLSAKPKGKWFCKRCVAAGQNKSNSKKKSKPGIIEKYASQSDKSEVEQILSADDSD